jgi:KRAB domain-containing zinc finger protein
MEESKDCMICQKINFRYFVDFKKHKMTHHNEIICCKICEKNNYTLFRHKQYGHKHEVVKTFNCTECTSVFKTKEQLDYHMEIHAKNFPCSTCSKVFTRRYLLKQHELTHANPKQFYCEICDKSFQRKFCLDSHRKNIHSDKKKEENYLKQLRGMNGEKSIGWISCDQCPALFRNKQSHHRHMSLAH